MSRTALIIKVQCLAMRYAAFRNLKMRIKNHDCPEKLLAKILYSLAVLECYYVIMVIRSPDT